MQSDWPEDVVERAARAHFKHSHEFCGMDWEATDVVLSPGFNRPTINWQAVAERYQGIVIAPFAPYVWSRRLHETTRWYYGWDCASGCIWDASAIALANPPPTHRAIR